MTTEMHAPEAAKELRRLFDLFDYDGDGAIDAAELTTVLRALGQSITKSEVQDMILEADVDGTGTLNFEEVLTLMGTRMKDTDMGREFKETFKEMDMDGDGALSTEDLTKALAEAGERFSAEEVREIVAECDKSGKGRISLRDFREVMDM